MSADTIGFLAILIPTLGFFALLSWMAVRSARDDPPRWPDGPQPDDDFDVPFHEDNIRTFRVTALPVREPVWLFRPDSTFNAPGPSTGGSTGDDLVAELLMPLVAGAVAALTRFVLASSDRRWKVVVDRRDKRRFAIFHAVAVEIFNSESEALARRDEIVKGWTHGAFATTPRLSRRDIARIRIAAPAYIWDPSVLAKPPLTPRARAVRRVVGTPLVGLGGISTLFWLIGVVAPPFSWSDFVTALVMAAISAAVTIGGWKVLALGR